MANFLGYFFKGYYGNTIFPNKYIKYESYTCTPNQREEIKAYRDENTRKLTRVTASGMKTKLTFTSRGPIHKADKVAIISFFTTQASLLQTNEPGPSGEGANAIRQRKVRLTYWNDEDDKYETSYFYLPNIEFKIQQIKPTSNSSIYDIIYEEMEFELIEY